MSLKFFCSCRLSSVEALMKNAMVLMQQHKDGTWRPCCEDCYKEDVAKQNFAWMTCGVLKKIPFHCVKCTVERELYHPAGMDIRAEWIHCRSCLKPDLYKMEIPGCFFATFDEWPFTSVPNMVLIQ